MLHNIGFFFGFTAIILVIFFVIIPAFFWITMVIVEPIFTAFWNVFADLYWYLREGL